MLPGARKNDDKPAAKSSCCAPSTSCCAPAEPLDVEEMSRRLGYREEDVAAVPDGANMGLGCGNPQVIADLKPGETVLDLGAGGGFDCFLAAKAVGDTGSVIGVDMTPDMVSLARKNAAKLGLAHVDFRLGEIEHLPVADASVDVIISNCVINLSPDKAQVFKEAFRVLKPGGRLAISDVVALRELPDTLRNDAGMYAGCVGGAALASDVEGLLRAAGFAEVKVAVKTESRAFIKDWAPGTGVEDYVASADIEAIKG